jgi:uncharacterized protein
VKPILLDTGPIVALLDPTDASHHICAEALANATGPLVTCEAVIAESCYLLRKVHGVADVLLENITNGVFQIPFELAQSASEIGKIFHKYRDREIDLADACLIHLANEYRTGDILTLDRDFHIYRWGRNQSFHTLISLR